MTVKCTCLTSTTLLLPPTFLVHSLYYIDSIKSLNPFSCLLFFTQYFPPYYLRFSGPSIIIITPLVCTVNKFDFLSPSIVLKWILEQLYNTSVFNSVLDECFILLTQLMNLASFEKIEAIRRNHLLFPSQNLQTS